jgi:hypothetical protein
MITSVEKIQCVSLRRSLISVICRKPVSGAFSRRTRAGRGLAARPTILKQRREIAEHPFGSIKQWMNQGTFLLRGLEKVRAEFSLTALAYNFIRMVNIVGVATLLKAV